MFSAGAVSSERASQPCTKQTKLLRNLTLKTFIPFCCSLPTVRRTHECALLTSRLPGPPGSSLLHGSQFHHNAKAEPDIAADIREEAAAEAEPAPAGQLQDDTAAADLLRVWGPTVVWPHIQHSAHPHRGIPVRTLDDAVWRQTENTLAEKRGSYTCLKKTHIMNLISSSFECFVLSGSKSDD